jgi:type III secretion protein J
VTSRVGHRAIVLAVASVLAAACSVPVAAELDEGDASDAVVALEKGGVASEKERDPEHEGRYRVVVSRDDAPTALRVLSAEGLPPKAAPGVLDALGKGSLVPSRLAEHVKVVTGTSGDLERSLRAIDGVVSARVHLAVPPRDPLTLGEQAPRATASVLIRHQGPTPPLAAFDVQRLVAGAVPGLSADNVSIVMAVAPAPGRSPARELSRLGPVTVTRSSMAPLRGMIAVAVLSNVVLLGCLLLLWARVRRTEGALASRNDEPGAPKPSR